jgi:hypothetical protein
MFLVELIDTEIDTAAIVLGLLNFIKKRYENMKADPKIKTASFLALVKNTGAVLDYDGFVDLYNSNNSIKNMISNFNAKTITINSGPSDTKINSPAKQRKDQDIVGKMAAQAVDI